MRESLAVPGRTKYQGLFDETAEGDRLREVCLLCRRADVLPIFVLLQEQDDSPSDLLQCGRRVFAERLQVYGVLTYSERGAPSIAWQVLLSLTEEDGYYFSVHELQVLMAVHNVRVEAYNLKPGVYASESFEPLVPEWL